ncbi:hypothetical protein BTVI_03427 [Pitangus sulphuratus]|nr:hypothetical protein BTVI_03427 [Pitangus sulphuratus]
MGQGAVSSHMNEGFAINLSVCGRNRILLNKMSITQLDKHIMWHSLLNMSWPTVVWTKCTMAILLSKEAMHLHQEETLHFMSIVSPLKMRGQFDAKFGDGQYRPPIPVGKAGKAT